MNKIPKNLAITDFPADLAERCLLDSGELVLTKAVLSCLYNYFSMKLDYSELLLKKKDLQADLDKVLLYWKHQEQVVKERMDLEKFLKDPNRFHLHGD